MRILKPDILAYRGFSGSRIVYSQAKMTPRHRNCSLTGSSFCSAIDFTETDLLNVSLNGQMAPGAVGTRAAFLGAAFFAEAAFTAGAAIHSIGNSPGYCVHDALPGPSRPGRLELRMVNEEIKTFWIGERRPIFNRAPVDEIANRELHEFSRSRAR